MLELLLAASNFGVDRLVSASLRVLPLGLAIYLATRPGFGLAAKWRAPFWWSLPVTALVSLFLPSLLHLPILAGVALVLLALWLLLVGVRIASEVKKAIRVRRVLDGAQPLTGSEAQIELRLLADEMGFDLPPRLASSDFVSTPFVVGLLSPAVLMPSELDSKLGEEDMRMLLAHEMAHLRRGDLPLALLPALAEIILPFHPLLRLAAREWILAREEACDEEAIAAAGVDQGQYGEMLLKVSTLHQSSPLQAGGLSPVFGATANFGSLQKRLTMLKVRQSSSSATKVAISILALSATFAVSAISPSALTASRVASATPSGSHPSVSASQEKNLVLNGGFEDGSDPFAMWEKASLMGDAEAMGVKASRDTSVHHTGKASLKFNRTTQRYNPVLILNQKLPAPGGAKRIHVSGWVKADQAGKATIAAWFHKGDEVQKIEWGVYVQDMKSNAPLTHDWKMYDSVLELPTGTDGVELSLQMYGPGTVWLDDVSAEYVPDSTPLKSALPEEEPKVAYNSNEPVLQNGGFEHGESNFLGWTEGSLLGDAKSMGVSVKRDSKIFHSGKSSLMFERTTPRFNPVLIMNQELNMPPDAKRIRVKSWVRADHAGKATIAAWFLKDGEVQKIEWAMYAAGPAVDSPLTHGWKQYETVLALPEGTDGMVLSLQMYGPGKVWIDDVEAEFVPESTPLKPAI